MTYAKIQEYIKEKHGFTVKLCWIADAKELCGLPVRKSPRRQGEKRKHPCPENKFPVIKEAFKHFGLLKK